MPVVSTASNMDGYKVVVDENITSDECLVKADRTVTMPWPKLSKIPDRVFAQLYAQRAARMLIETRQPLPDRKLSRRSRRRWRGQGGVWIYDPTLLKTFQELWKTAYAR